MSQKQSAFSGIDVPDYGFIQNCIHCGLCLPACPTYELTGDELSSPRGRIRLMKSVAEGKLAITDEFVREMNFCLDCQACQTACPAGVHYGALVEAARVQVETSRYGGPIRRLVRKLLLVSLFKSGWRLRFVARVLRTYSALGLKKFVEHSALVKGIFPMLSKIQSLSPTISKDFFSTKAPGVLKPSSKPRYRVAMLSGCVMDVAFADVDRDTVRVLTENGCEVVNPVHQKCCGSIQAHNGDFETARKLARHNIDQFLATGAEFIIANAAGCSAFMKEYGDILRNDSEYAAKAKVLSSKVKDLSEFLVEAGFKKPEHEILARVTYHDPCHLVHTQKISAQPREILRAIPGVEFVELEESTWCCGSAGTYNIVHYDDSMKLLDRKMENVRKTGASILVTSNPGCHIQLEYGVQRGQQPVEVVHIATLLKRAYEGGGN